MIECISAEIVYRCWRSFKSRAPRRLAAIRRAKFFPPLLVILMDARVRSKASNIRNARAFPLSVS